MFLIGSSAFAQFIGKDHLSVALFYMQKTELDSARRHIDLAVEDTTLNSSAKTWYYRGFIYKDLYKRNKTDKKSPQRLVAIESFKKMKEIDALHVLIHAQVS